MNRSRATQSAAALFLFSSMIHAVPSWAGPIYDRTVREHQEAARQLDEAQQRVFDRLNDYYTVSKSPNASPQKVEEAKQAISSAQSQVFSITNQGYERLNTLFEVLVYRGSTGTIIEADPNKRDAEGYKVLDDDADKSPGAVLGGGSSGGSAGGADDRLSSANPTASPTAEAPPENEIKDASAPRQEVFKKKRGFYGNVQPAPDPKPKPSPN